MIIPHLGSFFHDRKKLPRCASMYRCSSMCSSMYTLEHVVPVYTYIYILSIVARNNIIYVVQKRFISSRGMKSSLRAKCHHCAGDSIGSSHEKLNFECKSLCFFETSMNDVRRKLHCVIWCD